MILRYIGRGILWTIRLLIIVWLLSLLVTPTALAYDLAGWRWAILTALVTIGVAGFLYHFFPWLIGRWIARGLAEAITADVDALIEEVNSGLWNPLRRESVKSHIAAEGIDVSPNTP